MVIKCGSTLWNKDPQSIPPCVDGKRLISRGPLINLTGLQALLESSDLDVENDEHLWVATDKCQKDLQKNRWTYAQVGCMLSALRPGRKPQGDYKKSEWCEVEDGGMYPCDVYELPYDEERSKRSNNGLPVYLKFSLDTDGALMLVLVSCHPS